MLIRSFKFDNTGLKIDFGSIFRGAKIHTIIFSIVGAGATIYMLKDRTDHQVVSYDSEAITGQLAFYLNSTVSPFILDLSKLDYNVVSYLYLVSSTGAASIEGSIFYEPVDHSFLPTWFKKKV